jgi:hypothetical protein
VLANRDELRKRSISTWRRVKIAAAIGAVTIVGTLILPQLVWFLAPFWMLGFGFAAGSMLATEAYKRESLHKYWSAGIDPPTSALLRLIIQEEIK